MASSKRSARSSQVAAMPLPNCVTVLVLALALTLAFPGAALAQLAFPRNCLPQTVRLHVVSWHDRGDFNNANLGVALRWNGGLAAGGFYHNYRPAGWVGGLGVPAVEG